MRNRHLHLRPTAVHSADSPHRHRCDSLLFNDNGFTLIDTPIFTAAAGEANRRCSRSITLASRCI